MSNFTLSPINENCESHHECCVDFTTVEKTECPENYLENLYNFIKENESDEDNKPKELIFTLEEASFYNVSVIVSYMYFVQDDIESLRLDFEKMIESSEHHDDLDTSIDTYKSIIQKIQENIENTTFEETKKGLFIVFLYDGGELPLWIDDTGVHIEISVPETELTFKTRDYKQN